MGCGWKPRQAQKIRRSSPLLDHQHYHHHHHHHHHHHRRSHMGQKSCFQNGSRTMPLCYPIHSALHTEYGKADGKSIKEYSGFVPLGWYLVQAIDVDRYETTYMDYDDEGREARFYKHWKTELESRAIVRHSLIRAALAQRRALLYAKFAAIINPISPLIQGKSTRMPRDCRMRILQFLVHAADLPPDILRKVAEKDSLQTPPRSPSPRWLWMREKRLQGRWASVRRPCEDAWRRLDKMRKKSLENPWNGYPWNGLQ